jgi:3-deoxy-D-manno-octulosonate 8-phosphate phosphatase (KDO 8-P phosphatase)
MSIQSELEIRLRPIRFLATDVDGVWSDGTIILGVLGALADTPLTHVELKSFNARDGMAVALARAGGIETAWITGRTSPLVERRASEIRVRYLRQGVRDKGTVLRALMAELSLRPQEVLYLGDDLNDVSAFEAAGVSAAPADAAMAVLGRVDWVTEARGGYGAVREVVDTLLHVQGRYEEAEALFLRALSEPERLPGAGTQ